MFNIFRKKMTLGETAKIFPVWERIIKVGLFKRLTDELISKKFLEDTAQKVAAQGVNYISGEDWEANIENASSEIKSVIEKHKAEVIPSVISFLEKDKISREIVVYFLRIKSVLMFVAKGASEEKQGDVKITDATLESLNITRKDVENSNKMFTGHHSRWTKDPMNERINKILIRFGSEFPEDTDPVKFDKMVLNFHRIVFSKK